MINLVVPMFLSLHPCGQLSFWKECKVGFPIPEWRREWMHA